MPSEEHEQLVQLLLDNPSPDDTPIEARREGFDGLLLSMPVGDDVKPSEVVDADGVPVHWVEAEGARPDRVVLQVHGGGAAMGTATTYRELASRISRRWKARVAIADYRLAPEHPYPAPLDDCFTAYKWLLAQGIPAGQIVVVGDSGGVNLALTMVAKARDEGVDVPAAVVGFTPWFDLTLAGLADEADAGDPMITKGTLKQFAGWYLNGHSPTDPALSILHADLKGMPQTLLLGATRDVGYRDALAYAEQARAAGVDVTVKTFHGLVHNFEVFANLPEAAEAIEATGAYVDERLSNASTKEPVS
jgi:acetyl esterase/lipase